MLDHQGLLLRVIQVQSGLDSLCAIYKCLPWSNMTTRLDDPGLQGHALPV